MPSNGEIATPVIVVIASGGYESNPDLVRIHEGLPGWQSMFPDTLTGDGLVMALEQGAAIDTISNNLSLINLQLLTGSSPATSLTAASINGVQEPIYLRAPHITVPRVAPMTAIKR